ncbi:uncharacterized protein [Watersipora subatra]|uniref:uncharacterized protein n=1 Tax=Watersipora subatra TaxID=2589382 RepID=UPI00355C13CA
MAENDITKIAACKRTDTRSKLATIVALISLLITIANLCYVFYYQRHEALRYSELEGVCKEAKQLREDLKLARPLVRNLRTPEAAEQWEGLKRVRRDETGLDDDEQAEEDLSELSLTALSFLRGPPGFPGRDGRDAEPGPRGLPGPKGDTGRTGLPGANGERGTQGIPGLNGRDGIQGPVGPRGNPGDRGPAGNPGAVGAQGLPGARGDRGEQGVQGPPGPQGAVGEAGSDGTAIISQPEPAASGNLTDVANNLVTRVRELEQTVNLLETIDENSGQKVYRCPSWTQNSSMSQTVIGTTCYVLVNLRFTVTEGNNFCKSQGYNLVHFDTSTKQTDVNDWLLNTLGRSYNTPYWTGGFRPTGRPISEWFWRTTNENMTIADYTDWASGEPDSGDYCLAGQGNMWHGRACNTRYNIVCEGSPAIDRLNSQQRGGAVFTHWGKSTCSNSSSPLYSGLVAGAKFDTTGGGVNFQCLPPNPELNDYNPRATAVSWIKSVEYESQAYGLFADNIDNTHAVCSRCYTGTRPAILMIPGKISCPEDWVKEYSGFMMAAKEDEGHPTTYECFDSTPQFQGLVQADLGGRLWFVNIDCDAGGSVGQCNSYRHGRQLTCVVCTK